MTGFGHDWPSDEGWSATDGTIYHDGKVYATIHPGQENVKAEAERVVKAMKVADFDPMKTSLMMAD